MKKILVISILLVLLVSLIPYNVEAHASCDIKLIRREKELLTLIQAAKAQRTKLALSIPSTYAIHYNRVTASCFPNRCSLSQKMSMLASYGYVQAKIAKIDKAIIAYEAELKDVQSKLKDNCKHR